MTTIVEMPVGYLPPPKNYFYSRGDFHTSLFEDIDLLKDDLYNSVREKIGYCFVVPVSTLNEACRAGANIGAYNDFEPRFVEEIFVAIDKISGPIYVGYEYSPVIYAPINFRAGYFLPSSDELCVVTANDTRKYLRFWWD